MRRKGLLSGALESLIGQTKPSSNDAAPNIDYPQPAEKISTGHYAIRISGCQAECEVAVDDGDWQACRSADGFCWYDWTPREPGRHRISVRARGGNRWLKAQRTCQVN